MSVFSVKEFFKSKRDNTGLDFSERVLEFPVSSATVALAALAVGCEEARIAKTLSFKRGDEPFLIVTAGDVKIDNTKYKAQFGIKAKMLSAEEALAATGHPIGGVCVLLPLKCCCRYIWMFHSNVLKPCFPPAAVRIQPLS